MDERVLEFRRRVLPENHPSIGEGRAEWCCMRRVECEGMGFAYCDVQARTRAVLQFHTPLSGGTRMRLR